MVWWIKRVMEWWIKRVRGWSWMDMDNKYSVSSK